MKRAETKTAVPLSAGERYFEFADSSKQLDRARKALRLKENEALLAFTDGEKEPRWRLTCIKRLLDRKDAPFTGKNHVSGFPDQSVPLKPCNTLRGEEARN